MKPTPLTDEQISDAIENCSSDTKPDFLVEFARAIESARDKQWQEMLKQEPSTLTYWADKIDPFTREEAPDHLTLAAVAHYLRGAQPAQQEQFKPDWANYQRGLADGKAEAAELLRKALVEMEQCNRRTLAEFGIGMIDMRVITAIKEALHEQK